MDYFVCKYTSIGIEINMICACVFVVFVYDVDVCDIAATDKIATLVVIHGVSETGFLLNGNRIFLSPVDSFIFVWRQDGVVCADFEMEIVLLERGGSEMTIFIRNVVFVNCVPDIFTTSVYLCFERNRREHQQHIDFQYVVGRWCLVWRQDGVVSMK